MINTLKGEYSMRLLCEALDVNRSALYHQSQPTEDRLVREALKELAVELSLHRGRQRSGFSARSPRA